MQLSLFALFASLALQASAQSNSQSDSTTDSASATATAADYASGTYADVSTTITFTATTNYATIPDLSSLMATDNATAAASSPGSSNATTTSTSSATATVLSGTARTTSLNGTTTRNSTTTATSSSARPTNTVPCNGHPQFCQRKYSNITQVAAHNSPFIRSGSLAANQELDVTTQLNDGIRMCKYLLYPMLTYY